MELVRNFKGLTKSDANIAGGKGASLGEMTKAGIPVPPGFVVLAQTFERFIEETDLDVEIDAIFHSVDHKDIHTVETASEKIKFLILSVEMPKDIEKAILESFDELGSEYVAVRSSATAEDGAEHAWAGQLDSYLNTTRANVVEKVKHCWASLFTPRAIFYRFEKYGAATHVTKISVAVVVQKMVDSEISGIAFSVHPVTEDRNQLIIEAGFGLGEAIVSGQITPDSYVSEKKPRRIIDVCVNSQSRGLFRMKGGGNEWRDLGAKGESQVLTEKQITELSDLIIHIENHYGFPCDIEWAFEKGKFYIVQSRPITTLSQKINPSNAAISTYQFKSPELADFRPDDYVFVGLWKNDLFATCFWQDCFVPEVIQDLGLKMDSLGVINLAGGHYFHSKVISKSIDDYVGERIDARNAVFFDDLIKVSDRYFQWGVKVGDRLMKKEPNLKNFQEFVDCAKKINLIWLLGATYLIESAERKFQEAVVAEAFPAEHVISIIPKVVTPLHFYAKGLAMLAREMKGKSYTEVKADKALYKKLSAHAEKYPWVEVMNFIGESLTPERLYEQVAHFTEVSESAPYIPSKPLSDRLKFAAKAMHACGYVKQGGAEYFNMFSEKTLPFLKKLASHIGVTYREFVTLTTKEIESALRGKLSTEELKERTKRRIGSSDWILFTGKGDETFLVEDPHDIQLLKDAMIPKADKDAKEIRGYVGNPGRYTGPARIVMNTYDFGKLKAGDVLVTTMTTPDFVILMQKAGAIVTDIGGLLCHAAIVSREIGKPCVIGTRFSTHLLKDGDMVDVDADKGIVRII